MKIAFCAPADLHALARFCGSGVENIPPGQGSTATTPLIIELLRRGHEVTLFTLCRSIARQVSFEADRLRVRVAPARSRHTGKDLFAVEIAGLKQMMLEEPCDFIHAHWTYEFALAALATGIPTITTIHDLPWQVLKYFRDMHRAARLAMAYQVARKGTLFSAVSPYAAEHYKKYLRPKGTIEVIPNFVTDSIFELGRAIAPVHDRPFTYATLLQGFTRLKNATCALHAFQLARRKTPNSRLFMLGQDYEEGGPAHRWATQHNLHHGVVFKGHVDNARMLAFVADSVDVLVHPSLDESFCMAAAECMALKKPVIAGVGTPGVRWVLDFGRVGMLADVRNPEMVATAMRKLESSPSLRQELAEAAFEHAWKHFRPDMVVPRYEALYERLYDSRH